MSKEEIRSAQICLQKVRGQECCLLWLEREIKNLRTLSDIKFLCSSSQKHKYLNSKCKRVLSKIKQTKKGKKANVFFKNRKIWISTDKMPRLHSVLLPPNQSFYRNSCAHAKKSIKHTQYIYRYSYVYMYIYNIYI